MSKSGLKMNLKNMQFWIVCIVFPALFSYSHSKSYPVPNFPAEVTVSSHKNYPFLAQVVSSFQSDIVTCEGIIISKSVILSSMYCAEWKSLLKRADIYSESVAYVGTQHLSRKVVIKEWYNPYHYYDVGLVSYHDIAFAKLHETLKFDDPTGSYGAPIVFFPYPSQLYDSFLKCKSLGINENGIVPFNNTELFPQNDTLVFEKVTRLWSLKQCRSFYKVINFRVVLSEDNLCGRPDVVETDGESRIQKMFRANGPPGGPILCRLSHKSKRWVLYAIRSKFYGSLFNKALPYMYTRIENYMTDIENVMKTGLAPHTFYFCSVWTCGQKFKSQGVHCIQGRPQTCFNEKISVYVIFNNLMFNSFAFRPTNDRFITVLLCIIVIILNDYK